ncbi:solute carrier family 15 member 4 [Hydra vulgaris]|uniref:solute carrier family 15 member 4 n=1 Tax=Hydra vulgaris TaxID=6087 RepID=UPI0002B4DBCE|nr:solute carrier family 15 member 4 [Hydra vulgaris]
MSHRETVVYHQVSEETTLFSTTTRTSVVDYATISKTKHIYSYITLADIFQKVVYTTIITSLLLYIYLYLKLGSKYAIAGYFVFTCLSWFTAAAVNFLDDYLSRKMGIMIGFGFFISGVAIISGLSHYIVDNSTLRYIVLIPLYFICIGESLCKTLLGDFGHEQLSKVRFTEQLKAYTDNVYWIGHLGAIFLIAFLLGIAEFASFEVSYGLCCVSLAFGMASFMMGWSKFAKQDSLKKYSIKLLFLLFKESRKIKKELSQRCKSEMVDDSTSFKGSPQHWLDYARTKFGGSYSDSIIQEAKSFFKMSQIFISFIPYWICNAQGYSTFIFQAFHLNTSFGSYTFAVSWIALVNIIAVLTFVKLFEKVLFPALRRNGYSFLTKWRIIVGMMCALFSMVLAGTLQLIMQHYAQKEGIKFHIIGKANISYVSHVHILWAVPQFIFLGISEMLVGLTGLGLACKLCPDKFQKTITSVYYLMVALGHVLTLLVICAGYFTSENYFEGFSAVIYFYSLAGVALIAIILFTVILSYQESMTFVVHDSASPNTKSSDTVSSIL